VRVIVVRKTAQFRWPRGCRLDAEHWTSALNIRAIVVPSVGTMRHWWVNQNKTYRDEIRGGFMWSPKRRADGTKNPYYDTMLEVSSGDIVFSFCDTRILAIGLVSGPAQTGPKPDFGSVGANWSREGWYVPVEYCALSSQMRPRDHIEILRPFLPARYSPLRSTGDGVQSVYLTGVPESLAEALIGLIGQAYWDALATVTAEHLADAASDEPEEVVPIGATFREQLVKSRRGQGVFRSNVLLREARCRVTGVSEPRHLRASHIKPWRTSTDAERLDGANGLLLSPHIDHLFDQGFLTFTADQRILVVPEVERHLVDAWGLDLRVQVGEFTRPQSAFLDYHFEHVFKKELLED
jgi:putative restriction endonuclease